jgi:hypothetical protein
MKRALRYAVLLALPGLVAAGGGLLYLQAQGVTPRALAPYLERRSSGHNALITGAGSWLAATVHGLDRDAPGSVLAPPLAVGAQPVAAPAHESRQRLVASAEQARKAFAEAEPGDAIVFLPGAYRIRGSLSASRAGEAGRPIVVRAGQPGSVTIEFEAEEGFKVSAPYWRFENLSIRGVCATHEQCEHAFHVVGRAHHFAAVNNTIVDFNAHFKINGEHGDFPDDGLIEGNTLGNSAPRQTAQPVTPIDLVGASGWTVRRNLITDFIKASGDRISYGAFAKGAGARTLFEQNVVLCEQHLQGQPGQRVGLSFGGGGTGKPYCRDRKCITEYEQGTMRANLVASCSDAGIYLNSAATSRIVDNTLVDTAGVQVRYPETSAELDGNLIDGAVVVRNGARLRLGDNLSSPLAYAYLGYHPLRRLFRSPREFDFGWRDAVPRHAGMAGQADLCAAPRPASAAYGAFEDFRRCLATVRASTTTSSSSVAN